MEKATKSLLYSQPACPACTTAKGFLNTRKIEFEERDIRSDPEYLRELVEELGSRSTPTLVVGERVVIGFDAKEYEVALQANGG